MVRAPCVGFCDSAPVAEVGHRYVLNATSAEVLDTAARGETHPINAVDVDYETYVSQGGYKLLGDLRAGRISKEDILKASDDFSLRGLGGAGFPTGRKWRAVLGEPGSNCLWPSMVTRASPVRSRIASICSATLTV